MGARHKGRIIAFQTLYRYDITGETVEQLADFSWLDKGPESHVHAEALDFAILLVKGTLEKLQDVDKVIKQQLEHWDFDRLSRVDLAILRISVYSLIFQDNIPQTVTIDEAIDIAKEYSTDDSFKFINGVLDGVLKKTKPQV